MDMRGLKHVCSRPLCSVVHCSCARAPGTKEHEQEPSDAPREEGEAGTSADDDDDMMPEDGDDTESEPRRRQAPPRSSLTSQAELTRVSAAQLEQIERMLREPERSAAKRLFRLVNAKLSARIPARPVGAVSTAMHQLLDMAAEPGFSKLADGALKSIAARQRSWG